MDVEDDKGAVEAFLAEKDGFCRSCIPNQRKVEPMRMIYRFLGVSALLLVVNVSAASAQPQELPLGSTLPMQDHAVQRVNGAGTTIGALTGASGTVFVFWSNNCPWTESYEDRVLALHRQFADRGIAFVLVNANDPGAFPQDAASVGQGKNYPMPYVTDAGSQFAQAVGAFRTPHIFAFDGDKTLVYTGAIDDSPGDPGNVQNKYLEDVATTLAEGSALDPVSTKAFGCRIKFQNAGG